MSPVVPNTLKGFGVTLRQVFKKPITQQYPEYKRPVYPRFRGRHRLHRHENGLEKCVGCSLCAAACPADCIRVVAAENTPEHRVSAGERYAAVYEINLSRCIFCGYCEVACPFDAITMGHDYEMSDHHRNDLIFTKEMLLAEPLERTPLRAEGEWVTRLPSLALPPRSETLTAAEALGYSAVQLFTERAMARYASGRESPGAMQVAQDAIPGLPGDA